MSPLKILIIGNSIAGPALASFLLLSDLPPADLPHITLLERSPSLRTAGQNIDIRGTGLVLIRKLGIEDEVYRHTTNETGVQHVDRHDRAWISIPAFEDGPTAEVEILRGRLASIVYERSRTISNDVTKAGAKGIEYIFGDTLAEIEQDGVSEKVSVKFAKSGERRVYDLVIGADGLQSSTRKMVWGEDDDNERLNRLDMYSGFFSMPRIPSDTDWRKWFHAPGRRGIMVRPSDDQSKVTVMMHVISNTDERLEKVAQRGPGAVQQQKDLLAEYFRDAGWQTDRVTKAMMETDDFYYDMIAQVKIDQYNKGRVALVGDAGYCASPLSGMGTTLAFNGAYHLAGAITENRADLDAALSQYNRKMRPIVEGAQKLVPGMPHILCPETTWGLWSFFVIMWLLKNSGIFSLLFYFKRSKPQAVILDDYGLKQSVR